MSDIIKDSLDTLEEDFLGDETSGEAYREINYGNELTKAHNKAKDTVEAILHFYFEEELIEEDQYIKFKKATSEQTISQLMFLMKTSQEVLIKLMQNIDAGDMQPRMFEVLSTLQKSHLEIIQNYSMSLVATEEEVRRMQMEHESSGKLKSGYNSNQIEGQQNPTLTTNNTKELLKSIEIEKNDEAQKKEQEELNKIHKNIQEKSQELKPEDKKNKPDEDIDAEDIEEADFEELDNY